MSQLTESGILSSDTNDQHVKGNLGHGDVALDIRVVVDVHNPPLVINLGGLRFVVPDGRLLVAQKAADGLHDGAVLDGADGA